SNPRSTIGTMTDISDYLRMLYATVGTPRCPLCEAVLPVFTPHQMAEHMLSLPKGTEVEIRGPVFRIYGEDFDFLCEHIRTNGYRRVRIRGKEVDLGSLAKGADNSDDFLEVIIDRFIVEPEIDKQVIASLENGMKLSDGVLSFHPKPHKKLSAKAKKQFHNHFGCAAHGLVSGAMHHGQFTFNDPSGACPTCAGLGTAMRVHPTLLVPDPKRSLKDGAIVKEAFSNGRDSWGGRILWSLAKHYKFDLEAPFDSLSEKVKKTLFYGTGKEKFKIVIPPGARQGTQYAGKEIRFEGIANQIERNYRWFLKQGKSPGAWMENYLKKVMVEFDCPDCNGSRLKRARRLVTIAGHNIHEIGNLYLSELLSFLNGIRPQGKKITVVETLLREITSRLELLVNIGLDYLNLNRRSGTLSGGESQRIRLSTQIGSGLMGMLYVLDEPSIGLHPKDNAKMIQTLQHLRDIGNTVLVVEHDEDTIRAADHIVEIGPGPGIHGGELVASGPIKEVLKNKKSLTGRYLSGKQSIQIRPPRPFEKKKAITIKGARANNLRELNVTIPLGIFTCVTGASGSGKSSLVHEILFKKLYSVIQDSRVLPGDHDSLVGHEQIDHVRDIDQSPIGRTPRSNPATYIGFYDQIRKIFTNTQTAKDRGYTASRFSFNVKGGRCEECQGEGMITTQLSFMPDIEEICPTCKGARYNTETLEVLYQDKSIADVLDMSIEEGVQFFSTEPSVARKLQVMEDLGLGYLKLGHPSTILSGGEAQRIKLAAEISKLIRGKHHLYILDEPTTGLHFADIEKLLESLNRLVESGHTVIVIEHNLDVIKTADYIIDLGPDGGHKGGQLIAKGTPQQIVNSPKSQTGKCLARYL
ncbi:excinuclease ABC subunit UvrA, partial [Verrucomicrobia bacterium]|nr:excinuclease ABC subunit UvrA [Verrucomicrobiota bacterium]